MHARYGRTVELTLCVREVGDGDRVTVLSLGRLAVKDNVSTTSRAYAQVLLTKLLHMLLYRGTLLLKLKH